MKPELIGVALLGALSLYSGWSVLGSELEIYGWFAIACGVAAIGLSLGQMLRRGR